MENLSTHEKRKVKLRIFAILCILQLLLFNKTLLAQCTAPGATSSVSDTLSCNNATVTLNGSSPASGVYYSWTGPNGYTSFSQNPAVSLPGEYVLTVTTSVGGCTSMDTIKVKRDTVQPDASAIVTEMINCSNSSVTLQAVTSIPDPSFWWIGPNGYTSAEQNPTITVSGGYTLIVADQSNGCASTATVNVEKSTNPPLVSAYVSGTLTCSSSSVQLSSSSPTSIATFSWSGPNGYSSNEQNPSVQEPGPYTVTATNPENTCISSSTVTVPIDTLEPGASISASNEVITCTDINATLYGSSPTIGVHYGWSGPNGFSSTVQNPIAVNPGDYVLTITRVSTGCISRDTINITVNKDRPGATAVPSGQITCKDPSITLQGSSPAAPNVSYRWLASGFYSLEQSPTTSNSGAYLLTVTDLVNGCTSSTVTLVQQNKTPPSSISATNEGPLTCTDTLITLIGNSSTAGVIYSWTGPGDWISDQKSPTTDISGPYSVKVTNPVNGCFASASTTVTQNITPPSSVTAVNNGPITCNVTNINLSGSSGNSSGVIYNWTGPGDYTSNQQNPVVNVSGKYTLKVTGITNGCFDTASTSVGIDTIKPVSVVAGNDGPLTCLDQSINLSGSSSTSGVLYSWTGPNGYSSTSQNPLVSLPGTYNLIVKNPVNNCTDTSSTILTQDTIKPADVTASNDGPINCNTGLVTLSGNSSTGDVIYSWSGPNDYTSSLQNPVIDTSGTYSLTVTNPVNGCTSTKITTVGINKELPSAVNAVNDGPLTCDETNVTLTGSSVTLGVTYSWTGPNGFISEISTPTVGDSGTYKLTVTNPVNGCSVKDSTLVEQDDDLPIAVTATNNGPLTCSAMNITISGNSITGGVEYSWTGPSGFVSALKNPSIDKPGTYHLTVTDPTNGCFVLDSTYVNQDTIKPAMVFADNDGPITCNDNTAELSGSSSTTGVSYSWSGPSGFSSFDQNPVVDTSGTYYLTVTDELNDCFVETSTIVVQDKTTPGVTAGVFDILTCEVSSLFMSASSLTSGVEYSWTGPDNFNSTEQYPSTSAPGDYKVMATNPVNGCSSSDSITVLQDTLAPEGVIATVSDTLSCIIEDVILTASSSTENVRYDWSGPNGYNTSEQNPAVNIKGGYTLTVTNEANGCISTADISVEENKVSPQDVNADVSGTITCKADSVALIGSSTTSGVIYIWTGPGFTSTLQEDSVGNAGPYTLTVTDPVNGCIATDIVTVVKNVTLPQGITTNISGTLTCNNTSVTVSVSSTTGTVEYSWTGPDDFVSNEQTPSVNESGPYIVTITNTANGCETNRTLNVNQNVAIPDGVSASTMGILTCADTSVSLTGTTSTPSATFSWTGPNNFTSSIGSPSVHDPGDYTLVVTHPTSGCTDTAITNVPQDITPPSDVTAFSSSDLNCANPFVTIIGTSSTSNVDFHWVGPFPYQSSNDVDFTVIPGTYVLTVTNNSNGCTDKDSVQINSDFVQPNLTAEGATITCTDQIVTISANSTTPDVTYLWSENVILSDRTLSSVDVFEGGDYSVIATNPANGCKDTVTVNVALDNADPDLSTSDDDTITCYEPSVTLSASSATSGVVITWTGYPGQNPISVSNPDTYTVTALNPANGCDISKNVTVTKDISIPTLSTDASDTNLTCIVTSITLTASTTTPATSILWTGFGVGTNPIMVSGPGTYHVTAQKAGNGCTNMDSVVITQNNQTPDLVTQGATITCGQQVVTISASSTAPDATYLWSENVILSDRTLPDVDVYETEDYSVTVTDPANGCTNTETVTVDLDNLKPNCNIITPASSPIALQNNTISCQELSDVTYDWSVSGSGWSIVSGENTSEFTYMAGAIGTTAIISLSVTYNENGCDSTCDIELTAVALKNADKNASSMVNNTSILVYPNPFSDEAWVEFKAEKDDHVNVEIYSLSGVLQTRLLETVSKKFTNYKISVDGSQMSNGTYYCVVRINDRTYMRKLMLIKQ